VSWRQNVLEDSRATSLTKLALRNRDYGWVPPST
jgi:hypothetical protein